jgi:hypothetical protein
VSNGIDTANYLTIYAQGVVITQEKYMIISNKFQDTSQELVTTSI